MGKSNNLTKILSVIKSPVYFWLFIFVWFVVITIFLWLPQVNLLAYIVSQAPLDSMGKISFILEYYGQVLFSIGNPIVLTLVIFSGLTALSIVLLIHLLRVGRENNIHVRTHGKAYSGVFAAAFGSHLFSCGGTLFLAALFPAFSGGSAILGGSGVTINLWMSTGVNIIGIAIVIYTINKLCKEIV
jgi:hypothetical protein